MDSGAHSAGIFKTKSSTKQRCIGHNRECRNAAKYEGKWCGTCNNRRQDDMKKTLQKRLDQEIAAIEREVEEERMKVEFAREMARMQATREHALQRVRQMLAAPLPRLAHLSPPPAPVRAPVKVELMEEAPVGLLPAPRAEQPQAQPQAAPQPEPEVPAPPGSQRQIPLQLAQQAAAFIRERFPGGTSVPVLRSLPNCPTQWSDELLLEVIQFAGVPVLSP